MADGDQLLGECRILGQDVAHYVVKGGLVRGTGAQHGFALDSVEFPFDTCVIQIEAFGQAGQHVLTCFGVHYGKFQGRATAVKDQYQLAHVLHLPVLRLYADSVVSSNMDGIPLPGALWSQESAPNFSNCLAPTANSGPGALILSNSLAPTHSLARLSFQTIWRRPIVWRAHHSQTLWRRPPTLVQARLSFQTL